MIACLDVDYSTDRTCAACVVFDDWASEIPASEHVERLNPVDAAEYRAGEFYLRELPALLAVLKRIDVGSLNALLVDGYVWLSQQRPGMGQHLYAALNSAVPVIGVAKNPFAGNDVAHAVTRGQSSKPLFVTAQGRDPDLAARQVAAMHGDYRVPTMLRRVDQLCREG